MAQYELDGMQFTPLSEEFLSSFTPPNTYEIYDNVNDRSAVLNKYNFSQEIVHSKDPQKEVLIQKLDKEIQNNSEVLKELNNTLINVDKDINTLNAPTKIKEINLELEKIIAINNLQTTKENPVNTRFYDKFSPMFSYSLSESNKEYMKSLGLNYIVDIPKEHEELLKKDFDSGKITKEIYEKKYTNLMLAYTKLDINESYFDNMFKLYFNFIKPAIETSPLNWLHESHIFYPNNPKMIINDTPKDSRYVKAYNRDLGESSHLEKISMFVDPEQIRVQKKQFTKDVPFDSEHGRDVYYNDDKNDYIDLKYNNPIYGYESLKLNKSYLLDVVGIGHLFKDNVFYKEHLKSEFQRTFGEKLNNVWLPKDFDQELNLFYLNNGYEKDSKTDKMRTMLNKLDIRGHNLLTIDSFDEFNSLKFTKEEKTKFFLLLLVSCFKNELYLELETKKEKKVYAKRTKNLLTDKGIGNVLIYNKYDYNRIFKNEIIDLNSIEGKLIKSKSNKIGFHTYKTELFSRLDFLSDVTSNDLYNNDLITKQNCRTMSGIKVSPGAFIELENGYTIFGFIRSKKEFNSSKYTDVIVEDKNGNKKKYNFVDIITRFPYIKPILDLDLEDDGFTLTNIEVNRTNRTIMNEEEFNNLWNLNLNIKDDFEVIHNIYMDVLQGFDDDREFDRNLLIDKIWNDFYIPWYKIEEDKISFWKDISNDVSYKINNETTQELKDFYERIEYLLYDVYGKLMNQYSNETKESDLFDFKLNIDSLIGSIILKDKFAITQGYSLDKFNTKLGFADQDNYVSNRFLKETFNDNKLKEHIDLSFNNSMKAILQDSDFQSFNIGKYGVIIANKIINFVIEKLNPLNRPKEVNPLAIYSEITKQKINEIENKYGKEFIDKERPPYFPTVKHIVKTLNLNEIEQNKDSILVKYYLNRVKPMIDIQSLYHPYKIEEYCLPGTTITGESKRYTSLEKEINDGIFIAKIVNGIEMVSLKSSNLNKVIELEKDRSDLVELHNKMAKEFKSQKELRLSILPKYEETIKKMKELKLDNYVVTNNIDREKFIVTMKAIVDMTLNEFNKDKIIDLTKLDNMDDNLKKFEESLTSLNTITKNALISNYILHINSLYEKRGLTDKFNLVELNPLKKEIILNDSENRKNTLNLISQHGINSQGREINKIKMYEGNHFPLFIDLESKTIWSVEWTTKYPTLNIYMLPEKYQSMEQNKEYFEIFWDSLVDLNKSNSIVSLETFAKHFSIFDDRVKLKFDEEGIDYRLNNLDRIKDIFSLIQTNYFLQLEQLEEKSLFLDIDANYIYDSKPNIGAIPFMNKKDERILEDTIFKQEVENFNSRDVNFINPFNYVEKDTTNLSLMIQKRKVDGFTGEINSKEIMKKIQTQILKTKITKEIEENNVRNYSFAYEVLYGYKNYNNKVKLLKPNESFKDIKLNVYDGQPNLIKIFKTLEELQNYKNNYENTLNKDMNFYNKEISSK